MSVPRYSSLGAVIIGYGLCRVFNFPIIDLVGTIGDHQRAADITLGTITAGIPFASLLICNHSGGCSSVSCPALVGGD